MGKLQNFRKKNPLKSNCCMSHLLLFWFQKRTVAIDTLPEIIGFRVFQDIN
jgi:hypothetical protein